MLCLSTSLHCAGQAKSEKKSALTVPAEKPVVVDKAKAAIDKKTPALKNKMTSSSQSNDSVIQDIKKVIQRYQKSMAIKMDVSRDLYSAYLEESKVSEGKLYFSKGRLRLEIEKPEKYMLLLSNNLIWIENHLPKDMGGLQVSKISASDNLKQKNALLAFLFDDIKVWDKFLVKGTKVVKKLTAIRLVPKADQDLNGVVEIELLVDTKNKELNKIVYTDDLDNKTKYTFTNVNFKAKVSDKLFSYAPPKGAQVTTF